MNVTITEDDVREALREQWPRQDIDDLVRDVRIVALTRMHAEAEGLLGSALWRLEATRAQRRLGGSGLNEIRDAEETYQQRENAVRHAWDALQAEREGRA